MKAVLFIAQEHALTVTRRWLLTRAGYSVQIAGSAADAIKKLGSGDFKLVVLDDFLRAVERARIAAAAKQLDPRPLVLAFHTGWQEPNEDAVLHPQDGPERFLRAVGELVMKSHGHEEVTAAYAVYVDQERRYIHISDKVCDLLGRGRDEILGMRIEDVAYPGTANVPDLFQDYLQTGIQRGLFTLRHKNGAPVLIRYKAQVLTDGCMVSEWEPQIAQA